MAPPGVGGAAVRDVRPEHMSILRSRLDPAGCAERLEALVDQRGPLAVRLSPRSRPALVGSVRPDGARLRLQTAVENVLDRRLDLSWEPDGRGALVRGGFAPFGWVPIGVGVWCALLAGGLVVALASGPLVSEASVAVVALAALTVLAWRLGRRLARRKERLLLRAVVAALEARVDAGEQPDR